MTNRFLYPHWVGRLLLLASLFCWPIHDWAQEISGDMRTRQEKRIKDRLQEFYDNCVVACMDRDYDFIEALGKKHTLSGGAFKPDFGKFNEDGLWSFRNYCDNFIGLYGSMFEAGEMLEFRQSDIHFLSLKMVDGGNNAEANFTYTSRLYAGEQLIASAQKVEALLVISMMDPSDYRLKQIVPNQPVTVYYSPEEEILVEEEVETYVEVESSSSQVFSWGVLLLLVLLITYFFSRIKKGWRTKEYKESISTVTETPKKTEQTSSSDTPKKVVSDSKTRSEINGHEYVDLGLSVKWATCNVGASTPSDYGDYFAWGETKPKNEYTAGNSVTLGRRVGDIGGSPYYDAARANWGGCWRLPTKDELIELKEKCTWRWTTQDGHNGYKVTGPSGKFIFFPAAGWRYGASLSYVGEGGLYWSSAPGEGGTQDAYCLGFYSSSYDWYWRSRYDGCSVRPVSD